MDELVISEETERQIQELMADFGTTRYVALAMLGMLPGEVHGDGDLFQVRPLTDDERRRLGLGPESDDLPVGHPSRRTDEPDDLVASARRSPALRGSGADD
jgi:hypothetical protein